MKKKFPEKQPRIYLVGGSWRVIARLDMERRGYPLTVLHEYRMLPQQILEEIQEGMTHPKISQMIKKQFPSIKILILSMHEETQIIKALIKVKVDGYLFKNADKELLISAIISIAQGTQFFTEEIKNKIIFTNELGSESTTKPILPKLSTREKEVLELIAKGLTINQIADALFISHHTVVSHKQKLFYKFNVDKITSLVKKALDLEFID
jgi:DNA-binding NarL/FixJ family response regulator